MSAQNDRFERARKALVQHAGISPPDEQLWRLEYLAELARKAPAGLTHGKAHQALGRAVRTILDVLPEMIEQAEHEAIVARQEGRATDMDHFVWRAGDLLAAAEPFRPITARPDARRWWHGFALLMSYEVGAILRKPGKIVRIVQSLLPLTTSNQVSGALRKEERALRKGEGLGKKN